MNKLSWEYVRNKPAKCAELAAIHENFAWRKHGASKFGRPRKKNLPCADNSLSRAFTSNEDSILKLFSDEGNRTTKDHPEYGRPVFAIVWYKDDKWAILCTENEAVLIHSNKVDHYSRKEEGALERIREFEVLWNNSEQSLKIPLDQVSMLIS
jgi:hypothetical protein